MTKPTPDPPTTIATIVLPSDTLRVALVAALLEPSVIAALADALVAHGAGALPVPKFMSATEYAKHAKISLRTLSYQRGKMSEGVHFSRTGRRIRFHVEQADGFLSAAKGIAAVAAKDAASLVDLARAEASQRPLKSSPKGKHHAAQ